MPPGVVWSCWLEPLFAPQVWVTWIMACIVCGEAALIVGCGVLFRAPGRALGQLGLIAVLCVLYSMASLGMAHWIFQIDEQLCVIVCPHYTPECGLRVSRLISAAQARVNFAIALATLGFVISTLLTARAITRSWRERPGTRASSTV